ncbi:MAG: TrkH family potassium uptake protein [Clostridia bacterium]|nr:TrkH family potassium uptake protein [Clostridia bacterium]
MNYKMIRYLLGIVLMIEAALLLVPMLVAAIFREDVLPFVITVGILLAVSLPCVLFRPKNRNIYSREGFVIVALGRIFMALFGAIPFLISGAIPNYVNAVFETASGFTTTGSSILTEIESLPKGILYWRSFTHWIGGMGVLVFLLAILPKSDGQSMHLLRAEVPGPTKGKLVPKMQRTALILYGLYFALTLLETVALLIAGLDFYNASACAFATAGTGGFSVMNNSIAGYMNPAAEWIIAVFMMLFGVNFNLYFFLLMRRGKEVIRNEELRIYLIISVTAVVLLTISVWNMFDTAEEAIRTSFFQAMTVSSTAGFSTTDFNLWPSFAKGVLVLLMIVGGCGGSTADGLKLSRVMILVKGVFRDVRKLVRPNAVEVVRMDGEAVPEETVRNAKNYIVIYLCFLVGTAFALTIDNFDLETNVTAALTCLNNVGPGLGKIIGPAGNFAGFSIFSKILLTIDMLIGRLELLPIVVLFSPETWKKH